MTTFADLGETPFERLKELMRRLRRPEDGCPWDVEQTFETIAPYTIEEAYEVAQAIADKDMPALKEELGDLLFQVVFHAQMAEEDAAFSLDDVADALTTKMLRRHPHVFGDEARRGTAGAQLKRWEDIKAEERSSKPSKAASILDDVALALPALVRAEKLQKRAARVGFDWPDLSGVIEKISEEATELAEAAETKSKADIEDEMGDLLFAVSNLARKLDIDPETALKRTNEKFTRRFQHMEASATKSRGALKDMDLDEMEELWKAAKAAERQAD